SFPDNTPSVVQENRWHHVAMTYEPGTAGLWVDGRQVGRWDVPGVVRAGPAPLRIGAAGQEGKADFLLDADIAMPVLYGPALRVEEIRTRFEQRGLKPASDPAVLACWPMAEERGDRVADSSGQGRHGRIINHATWMIGGPGFHADVPRFGGYDP